MTYRLESLADLLREPDPGPTPMLVEDFAVANAVVEVLGPYKAGKTWVILEMAAAVASGRPAFGELAVQSGPVVLILEESSRVALHRRAAMLRRGWAQEAEAFEDIRYSANQRIRLDEPNCREWLLAQAEQIRPALTITEPLVRLKGADTDENDQRSIGRILDFFVELRDRSGGSVLFAHHTGHYGNHARGSSDIEATWESKIAIERRDGKRTIHADHRDTEPSEKFGLRLDFDEPTRSVRVLLDRAKSTTKGADDAVLKLPEKSKALIRKYHDAGLSANKIRDLVGHSRGTVLAYINTLEGGDE